MCERRSPIRQRIPTTIITALAVVTWPAVAPSADRPSSAESGESFYVVVYAAQEPGNHPETSHCFATFARIVPGRGSPGLPEVELHHINWFSLRGHQTGSTHGLLEPDRHPTRPERGANRHTRDALLLAHRCGLRVTRWGPYEIDRGLFERALRHIAVLEGRVPGQRVLYKALDLGYRVGREYRVLNCIHAVSDVDTERELLRTWTTYGDEAARKVVDHFRRWIKGPLVERSEVWASIWEATWQGAAAPASLVVLRGEPPRDVSPSPEPPIAGRVRSGSARALLAAPAAGVRMAGGD